MEQIGEIEKKKNFQKIIVLCFLLAIIAYIGRQNFSASIVEIEEDLNLSHKQTGFIASIFFYCYALPQIFSGLIADKVNTKKILSVVMILSGIINILMIKVSFIMMAVFWAINGLIQSIVWSSIIKTIGEAVDSKYLSKATMIIAVAPATGILLTYLLSSFCAYLSSWRLIFIIAGILMIGIGIVWSIYFSRSSKTMIDRIEDTTNKKTSIVKLLAFFWILIIIITLGNGFIKDSSNTWFPTLISEVFKINNETAIACGIVVPLFSIAGTFFARLINKRTNNPLTTTMILYLLTSVLILILICVYKDNLVLTILIASSLSLLMFSINNMLVAFIPIELKWTGKSGLITGILNTFCCLGTAIGTNFFGTISHNIGWSKAYFILMIVSIGCALASLFTIKKYQNVKEKNKRSTL